MLSVAKTAIEFPVRTENVQKFERWLVKLQNSCLLTFIDLLVSQVEVHFNRVYNLDFSFLV